MCKSNLAKDKSIDFAVPVAAYTSKKSHHVQPGKASQKVHEGYYAATDILTVR